VYRLLDPFSTLSDSVSRTVDSGQLIKYEDTDNPIVRDWIRVIMAMTALPVFADLHGQSGLIYFVPTNWTDANPNPNLNLASVYNPRQGV